MNVLVKLFSLRFIISLLGIAYTILQVRYFGTSRSIEVFFAAQSLIYLVASLTQSGQLAEVFLPEFHRLSQIKHKLGYQGLNVVINRMILWGAAIIAIVFAVAPSVIQLIIPGFSEEDRAMAALIFRVLSPLFFFQIVNAFFITVLNARKLYERAQFLGIIMVSINILSLVLLYPFIGFWSLVVSMLLGKIVETIFCVYQLYRDGFTYNLLLSIPEFDHKSFFKTMRNTFLYVGATQVYSMVLTAGISFLPNGIYAVFKYVQKP